jgi:hypothetical protein
MPDFIFSLPPFSPLSTEKVAVSSIREESSNPLVVYYTHPEFLVNRFFQKDKMV